ncbi:MAG: 4-(cytidine 5'-diphospho)-2-C-methyl-D-erythritol kinase [Burkholderiaceae bacterium]|nr:4-(cytidine 5'-diphospho)-2-C-methyl-D-erythritol kinase [Burkholderiaceae bacterium]MDP3131884.1 4-(cytidine 5'-diphospho)-2-C-methyl-D-erythritol kinase [Burkholderiaceae bacterium]MDZ4162745.1 4-(cytidine 5'-diphospho)-2-C-methyl-D-erythritol kinase [Burkholderiales bacterium]
MNTLLDVPAPAKINLFLHVTGQRPDGLHDLQTVFVLLDLSDSLDFESRTTPAITREDVTSSLTDAPLPTNDLCVKAARLLQQATGYTGGAHIRLTKRIPSQAGLGGGSSDAASCLIALNRLWETDLDRSALLQLAAQLGADVPFFVHGETAWAQGTGNHLQSIRLPSRCYLVVKPAVGLSTQMIFQHPNLKRDTQPATMIGFADHCKSHAEHLFGTNDLQPVASLLCPDIQQSLTRLEYAGLQGRMTGSGSAVFAPINASDALPSWPSDWFQCICHSLVEHPLKNWMR